MGSYNDKEIVKNLIQESGHLGKSTGKQVNFCTNLDL